MATNTKFRPNNEAGFDSDSQRVNILSVAAQVNPNETKDIDLALTDDHLLQGVAKLLVIGGVKGDKITLQLVHPQAGVVPEGQFVTDFYVDPTTASQNVPVPTYTAKVPAGLIIRCKYTSVNSGSARDVYINWLLHKVLA